MTRRRLLCALALTTALACNSDDANDLDLRDSQTTWDATTRALADARVELDQRNPTYDGSLRIDCAEGGTLHVVRYEDADADEEFQLEATFDACTRDGLTIDGELSFAASIDADTGDDDHDDLRDGSLAVLAVYEGRLELSGSVEGSCVIDAEVRVGATMIGHETTLGLDVSGTLCGHDAADVVRDEAQD